MLGVDHELGGVHLPVDLEVQVEQVTVGGRGLRCASDVGSGRDPGLGLVALAGDVPLGEVTLAQRH